MVEIGLEITHALFGVFVQVCKILINIARQIIIIDRWGTTAECLAPTSKYVVRPIVLPLIVSIKDISRTLHSVLSTIIYGNILKLKHHVFLEKVFWYPIFLIIFLGHLL